MLTWLLSPEAAPLAWVLLVQAGTIAALALFGRIVLRTRPRSAAPARVALAGGRETLAAYLRAGAITQSALECCQASSDGRLTVVFDTRGSAAGSARRAA